MQRLQKIKAHPLIKFVRAGSVAILSLSLLLCPCACSTIQYQQSQHQVMNRYLTLTGSLNNIADQSMENLRKHSAPMKGFFKSHGLPQMTYEFEHSGKKAALLFYIDENIVYLFMEDTQNPDSRYLVEHRPLNEKEANIYIYLTTGTLPNFTLTAVDKSI